MCVCSARSSSSSPNDHETIGTSGSLLLLQQWAAIRLCTVRGRTSSFVRAAEITLGSFRPYRIPRGIRLRSVPTPQECLVGLLRRCSPLILISKNRLRLRRQTLLLRPEPARAADLQILRVRLLRQRCPALLPDSDARLRSTPSMLLGFFSTGQLALLRCLLACCLSVCLSVRPGGLMRLRQPKEKLQNQSFPRM